MVRGHPRAGGVPLGGSPLGFKGSHQEDGETQLILTHTQSLGFGKRIERLTTPVKAAEV